MRRCTAALAVSLAAACASLPPPDTEAPAFELTARVAVRYGEQSATGRAEWRHSPVADDLVISNPLGQGLAEITRRGDAYVLVTGDGKHHAADDPEALTESVLGWRLPLAGLPDWVRAQPTSGAPARARRDGARLDELVQSGWKIEYLEYGERGLPRRMRLTRGTLDIRLVIEEWR